MTTWWMDENDPGDPTRATIVKRPDRVSSASVFVSLRLPAACEGILEKLTPSFLSPWQARYYVLRGPHLLYYADRSSSQVHDAAPLGAIDLRRVSSVECSSEKIILRSTSHVIRFRQAVASPSDEPPLVATLSQWASFIEDHRRQYQQATHTARTLSRISTRSTAQSGAREAEVVLTDIFTEPASRTSSISNRLSDRILERSNPLRDAPPDQVHELEMGTVQPRTSQVTGTERSELCVPLAITRFFISTEFRQNYTTKPIEDPEYSYAPRKLEHNACLYWGNRYQKDNLRVLFSNGLGAACICRARLHRRCHDAGKL